MSTVLEIRDGEPQWWNSPDIWVVPGTNPNGPPGQPVAGQPAFLWCRVHNRGEQPASGAQVNFYWSNPATGVLRSNSTLVGSAFVDLNPAETKEVLCVVPWIPVVVNNGHECIVAEIIHPSDPLPLPESDAFNPPDHRQIALKNLTVLEIAKSMMVLPVQVAAPARQAKKLLIEIEIGGTLDKQNLIQIGLNDYRPAKCQSLYAGLSFEQGCDDMDEKELSKALEICLDAGTAKSVYLKVFPPRLNPKTYVLLHVISRSEKRVDGGITYIVIGAEEE